MRLASLVCNTITDLALCQVVYFSETDPNILYVFDLETFQRDIFVGTPCRFCTTERRLTKVRSSSDVDKYEGFRKKKCQETSAVFVNPSVIEHILQ